MTTLALVFGVLAMVVVMAGLRRRQEVRERIDGSGPHVDDDSLRRIEEEGRLGSSFEDDDEPLDLDEIAREERRFWEESSWDEPEEF